MLADIPGPGEGGPLCHQTGGQWKFMQAPATTTATGGRPGATVRGPLRGPRSAAALGLPVLLLLVVVALPFLQVRHFDFVNYDDPMHVGQQPVVLQGLTPEGVRWSLTATDSNLWHPLTWISYMADVSLFGGGAERPGVHHLVNLGLHLLAVLALFLLLRRLGVTALLAWLAAALYGMHPLQAEPVAWISSRKDVLSSALALLCLLAYTRCRLASLAGARPSRGWRAAVWLLLAAALASKPSTVILPGLFVVIDGLLARSRPMAAVAWSGFLVRRALAQWPFLLLTATVALVAIAVQGAGTHAIAMAGDPVADRLMQLPARLGFFLQRTLWPEDLAFDYPPPAGRRLLLLWSALGVGLLAAITWLLAARTATRRLWGLGLAWYVLCLLPVLGLVYVSPSFTNDRYLHLGVAGPLLALALTLSTAPVPANRRRLAAIATGGWALLLPLAGALTWRQTAVWRDTGSLFRHGVMAAPMSATAWSNLASWHGTEGRTDLAIENFQRALALQPDHPVANYNLGYLQWTRGQTAEAVDSLRRSVTANPVYAPAHNLLGMVLGDRRQLAHYEPEKALDHLRRAHEIQPANGLFLKDYAEALVALGELEQAQDVLRQGLATVHPSSPHHPGLQALSEMIEATAGGRWPGGSGVDGGGQPPRH